MLIEGMKALYDQVLAANSLTDGDVEAIYASGMVTSPYGLKEVPHLVLPMTVRISRTACIPSTRTPASTGIFSWCPA